MKRAWPAGPQRSSLTPPNRPWIPTERIARANLQLADNARVQRYAVLQEVPVKMGGKINRTQLHARLADVVQSSRSIA